MRNSILAISVFSLSLAPSTGVARNEIDNIYEWGYKMISHWVPPKSVADSKYSQDSLENTVSRYGELVSDAIEVVYDENEKPLFPGKKGRAKTLAVLLSTIRSESSFRKDVDFGEPPYGVGDGGRSWCLMQIRLSKKNDEGKTDVRIYLDDDRYLYSFDGESGFGGEDLVSDRKLCLRVGLHMLRESMQACSYLPMEERLSLYSRGSCAHPLGREKSRNRMERAINWYKKYLPPNDDQVEVSSSQIIALGG